MSFRTRWQQKSGRAKAITIVATLLILQIGLCFGTPLGVSWFDTLFPTPEGRNPFNAIGYMVIEAISAIVIFLVFIGVLIFYPRTRRGTVGAAPHQGDGHP